MFPLGGFESSKNGTCGVTPSLFNSSPPTGCCCGRCGTFGTTLNGNSTSAFGSFGGIPTAFRKTPECGSGVGFSFNSVPAFGVTGTSPPSSFSFGSAPAFGVIGTSPPSSFSFGTPKPVQLAPSSQNITNANTAVSKPSFLTPSATVIPAFGGSSQPDVTNQCRGSGGASNFPTHRDEGNFASISAMSVYMNKSHEELRLEDYQLRDEGKVNFGDSPQQTATGWSPHFGGNITSAFAGFNPFVVASNGFSAKPDGALSTKDVHLTTLFGGSSNSAPQVKPASEEGVAQSTGSSFSFGTPTPLQFAPSSQSITFANTAASKPNFSAHSVRVTPAFGGSGQPVVKTQCIGSGRASYVSTSRDEENIVSISAMCVHTNKSHEELRLEDYQVRNEGPSSSATQEKTASEGVSYKCNQPTAFPPGFGSQPFGARPVLGNYFVPTFPTNGSFESPTPDLNFPASLNYAPNTATMCPPFGTPAFPQMSSGFGSNLFGPPRGFGFVPTFPTNGSFGSSMPCFKLPASVNYAHNAETMSPPLFMPAFGTSNGPNNETKKKLSTRPKYEATNSESIATTMAQIQGEEKKSDCCVPKGLNMIIEQLGVNPWANDRDVKGTPFDCPSVWILPCEEAEKDSEILKLAQFAVEQNNAMDKDGKLQYVGVIVASLEPVCGGRYHIVLEAKDVATASKPNRYYASVLLNSNHLAVLEKWLPGEA